MMSIDKLKKFADLPNIAAELSDEKVKEIEHHVKQGFDEDFNSMQDWLMDVKKVMDLASLKTTKKTTPLPNSANVKFPIITKAAYEFSSRTYPEIIKDGQVVKARVIGKDWTGDKMLQAKRVAEYMNYQLMFQDTEWESALDKLLTMLALVGFCCKKTYFEPITKQIKSEICDPESLIIHTKAKSLVEAERISHIIPISLNDLITHVRSDLYREEPVKKLINERCQNPTQELRPVIELVEQHCFLDLDEDDYAEPYIVTTIKESGELLRINARFIEDDIEHKAGKVIFIKPIQYFTDFHFLVNPQGHFQGVGFGILMLHLNDSINTLLNQIIDAGQLANLQGGYLDSRAKVLESGNSRHDPGELKKVKTASGLSLKDSVHMFAFKEPSSVLYQTLGLLIQTARDLSSASDVMTGNSGTDNVKTGAVLALQEEGRKVLTGINKRVYRALSEEYRKVFNLNRLYLDPEVYVNVLDDDLAVSQEDFDAKTVNIIPVADPNLSSEANRALKAQFLAGVIAFPGVKPEAITRRILTSTNVDNPDELLMSPEEMQAAKQTPNPEMVQIQGDLEHKAQLLNLEGRKAELEERKFAMEAYRLQYDILKCKTEAILNLAKAEAAEAGNQLEQYKAQFDTIQAGVSSMMQKQQMEQDLSMHEDEMAMRDREAQANAAQSSGGVA